METLHTWWATELYPMRERDQFGVSGEFEVVLATDAQATIAALQDERDGWVRSREHYYQLWMRATDERDEMRKERDEFESLLTQRTAELEAANKLLYRKNCALGRAETIINDLQAELERVRGELAETKEVEAALSSKVAEYEVELNGDPQNFYGRGRTVGLRTLVAALPKRRMAQAALTATSQSGGTHEL